MIDIKSNNSLITPWIIGHRGYHAKYPENTLASFQAAIAAESSMIELDVMLSADRRMVVVHDATLERTTNGKGPVADFTLAELKQLDAGSWFDPQYANQTIPELSEVMELAKDRAYLNIEIKSSAYEPGHPADAIERQVVDLLRHKNMLDACMISSFDVNILEQIAFMKIPPAIAFISKEPATRNTVQMCTRLKAFSWHPDHRVVTRNQVEEMHDAGIRVFPYNVNTLADCTRMNNMRVDGVITNDPQQAGVWLRTRKAA
jgi:glycerophosphoryl diester phosphodiesterase